MVLSKSFTSLNTLNDKAHSALRIRAKIVLSEVAFFRLILCSSVKNVMKISLIEIVDVIDAKNSNTKNASDQKYPPGICWKMFGKTSNTSFGPAAGSAPNENTAGKIITPARIATQVSRIAIMLALFTSGVLSLKYDA